MVLLEHVADLAKPKSPKNLLKSFLCLIDRRIRLIIRFRTSSVRFWRLSALLTSLSTQIFRELFVNHWNWIAKFPCFRFKGFFAIPRLHSSFHFMVQPSMAVDGSRFSIQQNDCQRAL